MEKLQAIRGMNDILPEQSLGWQFLEACFHSVVKGFGYHEIRFPVLEQTQLFKRSIGAVSDIVEKEMYSFDDRNGDNLSLRPEGTAGCVRAADQHGLLYNQQQRLWYRGPMFRHERPQKGRYRQFHQFGVEAFGMPGPDIDVEVLQVAATLWNELGLTDHLTLEINNIGSTDDRKKYSHALTSYLSTKIEKLDDDARNRMHTNPIRVLDSKNLDVQSVLVEAPLLCDFVNENSKTHFKKLQELLNKLGIGFLENPRLVRGLDYYNNCVYEWTTDILGAQGAVCGGGRYDGLVQQLGGRATEACGFAIGVERLVLMLSSLDKIPANALKPLDVYIAVVGENIELEGLKLSQAIRRKYPHLSVVCHCGGGKFNNQLKRAFKSGAEVAVILERDGEGDESLTHAKIRRLDESGDSRLEEIVDIPKKLGEFLKNSAS